MPITTCPDCAKLYDAAFEEEANCPTRKCNDCVYEQRKKSVRSYINHQGDGPVTAYEMISRAIKLARLNITTDAPIQTSTGLSDPVTDALSDVLDEHLGIDVSSTKESE